MKLLDHIIEIKSDVSAIRQHVKNQNGHIKDIIKQNQNQENRIVANERILYHNQKKLAKYGGFAVGGATVILGALQIGLRFLWG